MKRYYIRRNNALVGAIENATIARSRCERVRAPTSAAIGPAAAAPHVTGRSHRVLRWQLTAYSKGFVELMVEMFDRLANELSNEFPRVVMAFSREGE